MKILQLIFFKILILTSCSCMGAEPLYTRSECIMKLEVSWNVSGEKKWNMMREIIKSVIHSIQKGYGGPIPSMAFAGDSDEFFYLQYPDQCDEKIQLTEELVNLYIKPVTQNSSTLKILNEIVAPGPETINVGGNHWKDGVLSEFSELEKLKKKK